MTEDLQVTHKDKENLLQSIPMLTAKPLSDRGFCLYHPDSKVEMNGTQSGTYSAHVHPQCVCVCV